MNILVVMPTTERHKQKLKQSCPDGKFTFLNDCLPTDEQLADAEIIVGNVLVDEIQKCKKLRFLQLNTAGSDAYVGIAKSLLIANSSGAYGLAISEHLLGMLLMLMKKLHLYRDNQNNSLWRDEGTVMGIEGSRILTIGLGDIGGEFAKRCKALGAYTLGIRRNLMLKPYYIDEMHSLDEIDSIIPTVDVVALCLPNCDESVKLFNKERISKMKDGSILLNVGRGSAIDTEALYEAVSGGRISAGIDVTDPEPLPSNHPLWHCPNVIITPHISGYYHLRQTHDRIIDIAARNIENILCGEPIINRVDPHTGYRVITNRY